MQHWLHPTQSHTQQNTTLLKSLGGFTTAFQK
uniref:Uncharacterized protein n=1 Tax=Anguilla anguilla TaxID=7936 RepID=A0A0E9VLJ5_ANGAN